ncbi:RNase A-like domain-containing protein [Serratia ficaria]|uniref:RNase A-like domain-containing protein n=1 Tax=Serratia ficaria TaxID=61651 RepID=UPI002ED4A38E|nr:RNase A-like domain-containing protein [Serratia ficaria]
MTTNEGMRVVLSPVQLAAVMSDKSVTEGETLSNRLYGGLNLAGGVIELIGAGALCYAPDPTFLTKAGCVVVGTHSLDNIKAASNQIVTGQPSTTDTYKSAISLAQTLGADEDTAYHVGLTVDIAVPLVIAGALGAARVASVRMGRVKLIEHESMTGIKPGGHTLARHVGLPKEALLKRLEETKLGRLPPRSVSSFTNLATAESSVSSAMRSHRALIKNWAKYPSRNLVITHRATQNVGYYIQRGSTERVKTANLKVVIEYSMFNGKPYYILTAYPIP